MDGAAPGSKAAAAEPAGAAQVSGKMYVTSEGSSSYLMNMVQVVT